MASSGPTIVTITGVGQIEQDIHALATRSRYQASQGMQDLRPTEGTLNQYMRAKLYALARASIIEDAFELPYARGLRYPQLNVPARLWAAGFSARAAATRPLMPTCAML